jgi:dihydrodipicolinate reductase
MKVKVHTSVIGNTGYNVHARELLTELNKITPIKIRNFSVGNTWKVLVKLLTMMSRTSQMN